ncbi:MAG: hypothetical protein WD100_12745, partial [Tistlia sp.]
TLSSNTTAESGPLSLRALLLADAVTCAAMGGLLALAAEPLARLSAIPSALLLPAGLLLFPIAAFMALVATRRRVLRAGAWLVVLGNLGWVAGSLVLPLAGWTAPNGLGLAFLLVQAAAVALLAALEALALRHTRTV